jgi:hypothetical protein
MTQKISPRGISKWLLRSTRGPAPPFRCARLLIIRQAVPALKTAEPICPTVSATYAAAQCCPGSCRPAALLQVIALFPVRRDFLQDGQVRFRIAVLQEFLHADRREGCPTAPSARSSASLMGVPPVTHPPQENPMTIDATAPIAIPCGRRVRDSPCRIEGTCMAFGLSFMLCSKSSRVQAHRFGVDMVIRPRISVYG